MNANPELEQFVADNSKEFEKLNPQDANAFIAECQELYNAGFTPGGEIRTRLDEVKRRFIMLLNKQHDMVGLANSRRGFVKTASVAKLTRLARRRAMRMAGISDLSKDRWHSILGEEGHGESAPKKKSYSPEEIAKMKEEAKTDPFLAKMLKQLGIV